jgi:hypothetical protein
MRRRGWHLKEEEFLINNYESMTIKELRSGLEQLSNRRRSDDSINAKIKRLKSEGKIKGQKEQEVVTRALIQRRKNHDGERKS